ncbi:MAG TPA: hypothetical protein VL860_04360 [Planctomycetota bacterium]|nr:hypothetical protein [Planctomycetota bacterium]
MGRAAISSNCFACGAALKIAPDGKKSECVNPNCTGGRFFVRCGFCGQFAFAGASGGLYCWNNTCKMYKRKRRQCAVCGVVARIDFKNQDVCMNRRCPSNEGQIAKCFFCSNQAFLSAPSLRFCTKGDCDFLLTQVSVCAVCNEQSFVDSRKHCENRACKAFSQELKLCPSCNKMAMIAQLGHPDNGVCQSCGFSAKGQASTAIRVDIADTAAATGTMDFGDAALQDLLTGSAPPPANPAFAPTAALSSKDLFGTAGAGGGGGFNASLAKNEAHGSDPTPVPPGGGANLPAGGAHMPAGEDTKILPSPMAGGRKTSILKKPKTVLTPGAAGPTTPPAQAAGGAFGSGTSSPGGFGSGAMGAGGSPPMAAANSNSNPPGNPFGGTPAKPFGGGGGGPAPFGGGGAGGLTPFGGGLAGSGPQPGSGSAPVAGPFGSGTAPANNPFGGGTDAPQAFGANSSGGVPFGQNYAPTPAVSASEQSSLGQAFDFIKRCILNERGKEYPIFMVIGLPGSGKTTYLAMLGDILKMRGQKYHFPYPRVSVQMVQVTDYADIAGSMGKDQAKVLSRRILDLPTDYSKRFYEKYIEKMYWAAQTQPEVAQSEDQPSTFFLVANIIRDTATVAKLVTVETSGEDYQAVLDVIQHADLEAEKLSPMQRILLEMMDLSEGFAILVSPEDPKATDSHFQNLFNMINKYVEPRALQMVMNEALKTMAIDSSGQAQNSGLASILAGVRQAEVLREQIATRRNNMYRDFTNRLKELSERLKATGLSAVNAEEAKFLDHISDAIKAISPTLYQRAFQQMEKAGKNPESLLQFYKGMISHALMGENVLRKIVLLNIPEPPSLETTGSPDALAQAAANITEDQWKAIMIQVREKFGLSKNFHVRKPTEFTPKRGSQHMGKLKYISLMVTKSDMFPIVYPPERYVGSKLDACSNYLHTTEDYLKLLGGRVAYYNTSVTGYSILRDTMFYPSKRNTLTPINVVEPIFDMLGIDKDE